MRVGLIIKNDEEVLLQRAKDSVEDVWEIPSFECQNVEDFEDRLKYKCKELDFSLDISKVFLSHDSNIDTIYYETNLFSYHSFNDKADEEFSWVHYELISNIAFSNKDKNAVEKLTHYCSKIKLVNTKIETAANNFANLMGIEIIACGQFESIHIFTKNDYGGYCPFIFRIEYSFVEDNSICIFEYYPLCRMVAEGDKSDLYVLFSNLYALLLKKLHNQRVYVDYLNYFDPIEICSAALLILKKEKTINIDDLEIVIDKAFSLFELTLMMFEQAFGSFSLMKNNEKQNSHYLSYLNQNSAESNCFFREEHQYYYDHENKISLLCINNSVYNYQTFSNSYESEIVEGIEGKIIQQKFFDFYSYNFISYDDWEKVSSVIEKMNIIEYKIICQENKLYMLEKNNIWVFDGDFAEYLVEKEKLRIIDRQSRENTLLRLNRRFKWRYPVDSGRFEELIADLLETEPYIDKVRLVGRSNNSDGGRDLLIHRYILDPNSVPVNLFILGQCKAYKRSVNKSNVTDIRDTIEHYCAQGFFLAVTSNLTAPLIDHLCGLESKMNIDWWTEREVFKKLRQNPIITDLFLDIVEIIE